MKPDQERVRSIIHNTIISLCENGLKYDKHLRIEGVIGVTIDEQEIFLVHINESLNAESCTGQPHPGGRPAYVASTGAVPKPFSRRPSAEGALVQRPRPPFQSSPNNTMALRGFMRGSPRMNFGSPRMLCGVQNSPVPLQRTPMKSPRNPLQGMPRLQRFSPKSAAQNSPVVRDWGKPGLLSLPAPLTKEVPDEPVKALPPKQLFPSGQCRNSAARFPQSGDAPCKLEKMDDVILVDDDDHTEFTGAVEKSEGDKVESRNSPDLTSLPDLEPDIFPGVLSLQVAPGEVATVKDSEMDAPAQCEPTTADGPSISPRVPGCSGVAPDILERADKDDKLSTRASVDNSSLTSFEMGFSLDKPFNPEDYTGEEDDTEDMSFTDFSDEDWKTDDGEDTASDPDWSEKSPRKKKRRVTPRKTPMPSGTVLTPTQASNTPTQCRPSNTPSQCRPRPSRQTPKLGKFSEVPRNVLNSAGGQEDSWKLVARYVCNISGCSASFSQKYNLIRHQRAKHGVKRATRRFSQTQMEVPPELDQEEGFE